MHNIGSFEEAQEIFRWVRSFELDYGRPKCVQDGHAPEGWKYLGRGSFRSVWLSPSGVAYKVEHSGRCGTQSSDELCSLRRAWEREPMEGCRLPQFHGYEVEYEPVVAIEAIDGCTLYKYAYGEGDHQGPGYDRAEELYRLMRRVENYYKLWDMHDENIMVDETGTLVPVDFAD